MENMCPVLVYLDALYFFCINISSNMVTPVNDQHLFPCLLCFMCKNSTKQSRSNDEIIVFHVCFLLYI